MSARGAIVSDGREQVVHPATRGRGGEFVFDSHWRWIEGNAVAEHMVADGWLRGRLHATLDPVHAATREALQSAQRAMAECPTDRPILSIRDAKGRLVAFAGLYRHACAIGENQPRYVLYVRPLHWADEEDLSAHLHTLFGLTAAESRLAIALRRHGDTSHAAAAVGIAESSARTRLQSIFDKIDVHRLSGLLLLLDALTELVA